MATALTARHIIVMLAVWSLLTVALPSFALEGGRDVIVPAAARVASWITDLVVFNPGDLPANLTIYWLERNQPNAQPAGFDFTIGAGAALVLEDVILNVIGEDEGTGALRVVATRDLVVSTRIYNLRSGVTFGQGFEGIPRSSAVSVGRATDIAGLTHNDSFRTNVVVIDASGASSTVELSLRDTNGVELASRTYSLGAFEPRLDSVSSFVGFSPFDHGTMHATVVSGSAIVVASKVDNDPSTGDPTTLEAWRPVEDTPASSDGTYQVAVYDNAGYATGGYLTVRNGNVIDLKASYTNWDKGDPLDPDCTTTFLFGSPEIGLHPVDAFADGVEFTQTYALGVTITWTVTFSRNGSLSLLGSVDATGEGFSGELEGCNGDFPPMRLKAGKSD